MGKPIITLKGIIGKEPENKTDTLRVFPVAVNYSGSRDANNQYVTDWFNVCIWGEDLISKFSRFKKGDSVIISGSLSFSQYAKDGTTYTNKDISVYNIEYAGSSQEKENTSATTTTKKKTTKKNPLLEEKETKDDLDDFDDM